MRAARPRVYARPLSYPTARARRCAAMPSFAIIYHHFPRAPSPACEGATCSRPFARATSSRCAREGEEIPAAMLTFINISPARIFQRRLRARPYCYLKADFRVSAVPSLPLIHGPSALGHPSATDGRVLRRGKPCNRVPRGGVGGDTTLKATPLNHSPSAQPGSRGPRQASSP